MIPLQELITFFIDRLQENPPIPEVDWHEVCASTAVYLASYRHLTNLIESLSIDTKDFEAEGEKTLCGDV